MRRTCAIVVAGLAIGIAWPTPASAQASTQNCPKALHERPTIVDEKGGIKGTTWTELSGTVTVVIDGICQWVQANKAEPANLRLYLAGALLDKSAPTVANLPQDYLKFDLELEPNVNRDQWIKILWTVRETRGHQINIAVGDPTRKEVFESQKFITFNVYPSYTPWVVAGLVFIAIAMIGLGWRTNLLRMPGPSTATNLPFSLGLVQMAWWFYLVVACFIYIWLVTGEYNTLTEGVLALMGISAATGLGAAFVETQKREGADTQRTALLSQQHALQSRITDIANANPQAGSSLDQELQAKKSDLAKVTADIALLPAPPPTPVSKGFIQDMLRDGDGVKFHRFQIVVWTGVLGIVFIRLVNKDLAMPEFSAMLLGLMGLSSGTYIGFKFPEAPK